MKKDREADSGSEEGSSASSQEDQWDDLEEEAMRAFDDKLDALCPAPIITGTLAPPDQLVPGMEGPAAPAEEDDVPSLKDPCTGPQVLYADSSEALRELCKSEPYRPEDHVLTADEMWGGLSSDDEGIAGLSAGAMLSSASGRVNTPALLNAASSTSSTAVGPPQAEPPADQAPPPRDIVDGHAAHHSRGDKPQRLADTGALLQQACQLEPYKPEDHILTAEEMWGTSDSDNEGRASAGEAGAQAGDAQQSLHVEKQTRVFSRDAGSCHSPSGNTSERLRRVLAGTEAPHVLAGLGFAELSAVAEDCERAVATLRWVLARQHNMVAAISVAKCSGASMD